MTEDNTMVVCKLDTKNPAALYMRYPSQINPQDAYIEIDWAEQTISADVNGEIGNAVPFKVWHAEVDRFEIPSGLLPAEANRIMDEVKVLADKFVESFHTEWDGSNFKGCWNEEDPKGELRGLIEKLTDDAPRVIVWDAEEFYQHTNDALDYARTLDWADESKALTQLEKWIENVDDCDADDGPLLMENADKFAEALRDEMRAGDDDD